VAAGGLVLAGVAVARRKHKGQRQTFGALAGVAILAGVGIVAYGATASPKA
jgi:hypothetical protein